MNASAANDGNVRRPERVLLVSPQPFFETRGTPIAVRHILGARTELGFEVDVLTYPVGEPVTLPSVRIYRTPNPLGFQSVPIGLSFRKVFLDVMLLFLYFRRIRDCEYQYIHVFEELAFPIALIKHSRRGYVLYDMASSLTEQLSRSVLFGNKLMQAILRFFEKRVFAKVDHIACSAGLAAYVSKICPAAQTTEWFYPIFCYREDPQVSEDIRNSLKLTRNSAVVMYSGSFAHYQGIDQLLEAAADVLSRVPSVAFVLVGGTDEDRRRLQRKLQPELASRIHFAGRIPREKVASFLKVADVLVSPRLFGSNTPLKIMEYKAAGKPIVASDIAAHRAVLDQDRAVLVECTSSGLAAGIVKVLLDQKLAGKIGRAAQSFAEQEFSWPRFVKHVSKIYQETRKFGTDHIKT